MQANADECAAEQPDVLQNSQIARLPEPADEQMHNLQQNKQPDYQMHYQIHCQTSEQTS